MSNRKYWYFRFCENCFSDEKIRNMEYIPMIGDTFIVIYFKLCALSIQNNGYIRVPEYQDQKYYLVDLAKTVGRDIDTLTNAVTYFINNKLIEVYDDKQGKIIYIPFVENNIGKSSPEADKQRIRDREKRGLVSPYKNLVNDENKYQLESSEFEEIKEDTYGEYENVYMEKEEYEYITSRYKNANQIINFLSVDKKYMGLKVNDDYTYLLDKLKEEGIEK